MTTIQKLFVANRGEIARRIIRTAHDMGIRSIGVYVPADAQAPYVFELGEAYAVPAGGYLDARALVEVATAAGADAVHPGYGFLSENAAFAQAVIDAGLVWVGPPPNAIDAMGDKLAAKALAIDLAVPTLPMCEDIAGVDVVGYPLLVKAAAGGGGKGMRIVWSAEELHDSVAAAEREARAAFGDPRVFFERYVARSRHIEIQILGDQHGSLVYLGERECSIQRRHQKIVEEAPSPVVDEAMRARMGEDALRLARQLGYHSAGTVEFLVDDALDDDGERPYWFLEVNTRLQVEHPVTEAITGLDLVAEQLRVAMGEPLRFTQDDVGLDGHAVEARLYAEDAAAGFLPAAGTLSMWAPARTPAVRWDSGVEQGSVVGMDFDPMLAKVIAHAPTRSEAALRLALALERSRIGGVTTNRDFLVATLRSAAFIAGDTTTDFIERVQLNTAAPSGTPLQRAAAVVAALWIQGHHRFSAPVLGWMPTGWRNGRLPPSKVVLVRAGEQYEVTYRSRRDGSFLIDGDQVAVVHEWRQDGIDVAVGDRRIIASVSAVGRQLLVGWDDGDFVFSVAPRFAGPDIAEVTGGLTAPMPGRVIEVRVAVDDRIIAGQLLMILEAMKMEHRILASTDGRVSEVLVEVGDQVESGALLLVVDGPED